MRPSGWATSNLIWWVSLPIRWGSKPIPFVFVLVQATRTYTSSMDGRAFKMVHILKVCKKTEIIEMCNAVAGQIVQESMRTPDTAEAKEKARKVFEKPFVFELPLQKPVCDNTTKFSKLIAKNLARSSSSFWTRSCFAQRISLDLHDRRGLTLSTLTTRRLGHTAHFVSSWSAHRDVPARLWRWSSSRQLFGGCAITRCSVVCNGQACAESTS